MQRTDREIDILNSWAYATYVKASFYFLETSRGNFIWSSPGFKDGDDSLTEYAGSLKAYLDETKSLGKPKGHSFVKHFCGNDVKFVFLDKKPNIFYFDTEFIEDGKTIELVSIGIVSTDDRTYYAEVEGVDYSRADPWLHDNVFPHLKGGEYLKYREQIAKEIVEFVGENPVFWGYYADYDWVVLCQLYGRMVNLPKGWPMFCMDVKQELANLGNPKILIKNPQEHNALSDAIWTKNVAKDVAKRLSNLANKF